MADWARDSVFYHIYPLGLCGAPERNDFSSPPQPRILELEGWLPHIAQLGCDAIYLGPVFESVKHGYDTVDYFKLDRRLGANADLARFCAAAHARGMRVVLDGVFNHLGLDHPFFRDLEEKRDASPYRDFFSKVDFSKRGHKGEPFLYEGWAGHSSLPRLNLANRAVKEHLFKAVASWIGDFGIDGLRLDAADCLDLGFLRELSAFCKSRKPDFYLMAELSHGDYSKWIREGGLDSATNYECWKGLYSSMNDKNLFEIAHSLKRQFGDKGIYRGMNLYSFADNHDVSRVASLLRDPRDLYPLYFLLYAMPGSPSLYYGSEWGIKGEKTKTSDAAMRPRLLLGEAKAQAEFPKLPADLARLARARRELPELRRGGYREVHVAHECLAFFRETQESKVLAAVNISDKPVELAVNAFSNSGAYDDPLNGNEGMRVEGGKLRLTVYPHWGRLVKAVD
jgi:cyclomaltodextrinase / maltogenic alpha-amylase / neopullulanase